MKIGLRLPKLGATMAEGTIVKWNVQPGDQVRAGDILCEVETDKSVIDVESAWDATMSEIVIGPGEPVPVGTVIAHLTRESG